MGKKNYLYKIRLSLLTLNKISNSPPQWILRHCSHIELFIGLSVLLRRRQQFYKLQLLLGTIGFLTHSVKHSCFSITHMVQSFAWILAGNNVICVNIGVCQIWPVNRFVYAHVYFFLLPFETTLCRILTFLTEALYEIPSNKTIYCFIIIGRWGHRYIGPLGLSITPTSVLVTAVINLFFWKLAGPLLIQISPRETSLSFELDIWFASEVEFFSRIRVVLLSHFFSFYN